MLLFVAQSQQKRKAKSLSESQTVDNLPLAYFPVFCIITQQREVYDSSRALRRYNRSICVDDLHRHLHRRVRTEPDTMDGAGRKPAGDDGNGRYRERTAVKAQARDGANTLKQLAAIMVHGASASHRPAALAFSQDTGELASGLDSIADSQTDEAFDNAVFSMCDQQRKDAAPRVGHVLMGIAGAMRTNPPPKVPAEQLQQQIGYFETFGERLINIPSKCDQAKATMQQAQAQEQQAEAEHQVNVSRALNAAALAFAGAVIYTTAVSAAAASRPVVTNNYYVY